MFAVSRARAATEIQDLLQQAFQPVDVVAQHRGLAFFGRILPFPVVTYAGYHAERRKQVVGRCW